MAYEVTIETPAHGEVTITVNTAVFDGTSVRFTGVDPYDFSEELREEFTFHSKDATAILDSPDRMENITIGIPDRL